MTPNRSTPDAGSSWLGRHRIALLAGTALAVVLASLLWTRPLPEGRFTAAGVGAPVVMHTSGGRLEVATVTATEAFSLDAPTKKLLGIDLGKTVSSVKARVVYRFHIEMAREWPIRIDGARAIVEAGEIKPTLPVAFDTATMETQTNSGWARFDKHQNLEQLERRLSPGLAERAEGYKGLALESARRSVGDFVRTWLMKEHARPGVTYQVEVVFPGEALPLKTTYRPGNAAP